MMGRTVFLAALMLFVVVSCYTVRARSVKGNGHIRRLDPWTIINAYEALYLSRNKPETPMGNVYHSRFSSAGERASTSTKKCFNFEGDLWTDEGSSNPSEVEIEFDFYDKLGNGAPFIKPFDPKDDPDNNIRLTYHPTTDLHPLTVSMETMEGNEKVVKEISLYKVDVDEDTGRPTRPQGVLDETDPAKKNKVNLRGMLGAWGPNHAGDAIITRLNFNPATSKKELQVVLIRRGDGSKAYALPGGFVDPGEFKGKQVLAVIREFIEETQKSVTTGDDEKSEALEKRLSALRDIFGNFDYKNGKPSFEEGEAKVGTLIYCGAMDDWRNTKNAWMETTAIWWHLTEEQGQALEVEGADDAEHADWYFLENDERLDKLGVEPLENLYASHSKLLKLTKEKYDDQEKL